jgi:hypothetical protein
MKKLVVLFIVVLLNMGCVTTGIYDGIGNHEGPGDLSAHDGVNAPDITGPSNNGDDGNDGNNGDDGNNGHGNDDGNSDPSNPGQGHGNHK